MSTATKLAPMLGRLSQICDTGHALAIHIRFTRPSLLYQTYSREWMDYYSQNGLFLTDPVVRWGLEHTGMIYWNDLKESDPNGVLTKADSFGLKNGITYATGDVASRTITGWTKSGEPFTQDEINELVQLTNDIHALTEGIETYSEALMNQLLSIDPVGEIPE